MPFCLHIAQILLYPPVLYSQQFIAIWLKHEKHSPKTKFLPSLGAVHNYQHFHERTNRTLGGRGLGRRVRFFKK